MSYEAAHDNVSFIWPIYNRLPSDGTRHSLISIENVTIFIVVLMLATMTQCEGIEVKMLFYQGFSMVYTFLAIVLQDPWRRPRYGLRIQWEYFVMECHFLTRPAPRNPSSTCWIWLNNTMHLATPGSAASERIKSFQTSIVPHLHFPGGCRVCKQDDGTECHIRRARKVSSSPAISQAANSRF